LAFLTSSFALCLGTEIRTASSKKTHSSSRGRRARCHPKMAIRVLTPLMGFIGMPLHRKHSASTPGWPKPTVGEKSPNFSRVPSMSFLPTPTVYSAVCPVRMLHLTTGHGVRSVSGPRHKCHSPSSKALHPSKRFPPPAASLRHQGRNPVHLSSCPHAVVPDLSALPPVLPRLVDCVRQALDLRALLRWKSPLRISDVATSDCSMLPWAFDLTRYG
jgi:hypothetical protein